MTYFFTKTSNGGRTASIAKISLGTLLSSCSKTRYADLYNEHSFPNYPYLPTPALLIALGAHTGAPYIRCDLTSVSNSSIRVAPYRHPYDLILLYNAVQARLLLPKTAFIIVSSLALVSNCKPKYLNSLTYSNCTPSNITLPFSDAVPIHITLVLFLFTFSLLALTKFSNNPSICSSPSLDLAHKIRSSANNSNNTYRAPTLSISLFHLLLYRSPSYPNCCLI